VPLSTGVTEEASADVSMDSGHAAGVYYCPRSGCIRFFHRLSTLGRHLSLEKCAQSKQKHSLMDVAKVGYKPCLEQTLSRYQRVTKVIVGQHEALFVLKEDWALRAVSDKQQSYLLAKISHRSNDRPKP